MQSLMTHNTGDNVAKKVYILHVYKIQYKPYIGIHFLRCFSIFISLIYKLTIMMMTSFRVIVKFSYFGLETK